MGGTVWSQDHYNDRQSVKKATSTPTFKHDDDVRTGKVATALHDKMNPNGVKFRESRDSDNHPNSRAVAVLFDVTGSMGTVPRILQANLPKLMDLLIRKGYLTDPQILIGAIGDANSDRVPLQVGQFESGVEIDQDLENLYLEGNGGGQNHETYEIGMYFMAEHTVMDCLEKRGEKGYLFLIGDELYYPNLKQSQIKSIIGDDIDRDIPTTEVFQKLQEKFEVFFLIPNLTSHFAEDWLKEGWQKLLGERVLRLEDPSGVCELIAAQIAVHEGLRDTTSIAQDLQDSGTATGAIDAVTKALVVTGGKTSAMSVPGTRTPVDSGLAAV